MMNAGEFKSMDLCIVKTANGLESVLVTAKTSTLTVTTPSYNFRGYRIGEVGVIPEDYDPEYAGSAAVK
jgi:hypothetical protein